MSSCRIKQGRLSTPYKGVINTFARTYRDEGLVLSGEGTQPMSSDISLPKHLTLRLRITSRLCSVSKGPKDTGNGLLVTSPQ